MGNAISSIGKSFGIGVDPMADSGDLDTSISNLQNRQNAWQKILDQQVAKAQQAGTSTDTALNLLQGAATGTAPSQAQAVLQQGLDQSLAQQAALANSGNMATQLARQRASADVGAQLGQQTANQASILRAQEMAAAREGFGNLASGILGQQLGAQANTMGSIGGLAGQQASAAGSKFGTQQQAQSELSGRFANLVGGIAQGAATGGMSSLLSAAKPAVGAAAGSMASSVPGVSPGVMQPIMLSSEEYKENKTPIKDGEAAEKIKTMRIEQWDYKDGVADEKTHVGPYAEEFKETFGTEGDGKSIKFQDAIGITMKAVQDLAKNVDMLEKMIAKKDKKKKD
jgi:hypothetical protein